MDNADLGHESDDRSSLGEIALALTHDLTRTYHAAEHAV